MALIECKNCGAQISDRAIVCPKCGTPVRKKKKYIKAIIISLCVATICLIGAIIYDGPIRQNKGFKNYRALALNGNVAAQVTLGMFYEKGISSLGITIVPKDTGEAIKWYKIAAEHGERYAIDRLKELVNLEERGSATNADCPMNSEYSEDEAKLTESVSENEAIYNAYLAKIKENNEKYSGCEYFLWEIDGDEDGVPELWTVVGSCNADYATLVYAYKNGKLKQIYEGGGNCGFYGGDGYVIQTFGSMGHAYWNKLTFDRGEIRSEKVFEEDTNREYKKPDEYPLEPVSPDDDSPLLDNFGS